MTDVKPGDWAVVNTGTKATPLIEDGEFLCTLFDDRPQFSGWDHAVICSRVEAGIVYIVEAEPGGAVERAWHYDDRPHKWSTGIIDMPAAAGAAALKYTQPGPWGDSGVPYGWLDYGAIALHELHLYMPRLKGYIESGHSMICSQW